MSLLRLLIRQLWHGPRTLDAPARDDDAVAQLAKRVSSLAKARLGRSLAIREVDAGSCNGCELEIHAVNGPLYDLERYGIHFVASPRHADVLLVTGPVSANMIDGVRRTYDAAPAPKWVVAMGDCAVDGGLFANSYAVLGGVAAVLPVDLVIPGCPPTPAKLLAGLLALLDKTSMGEPASAGASPVETVLTPSVTPSSDKA